MSQTVAVAPLAKLKEGMGYTVEVKGRLIALFLVDGNVFAIDDSCPHMGASLGDGNVCDGIVTCPWHGWRFRVADGGWADSIPGSGGVNAYNTQVQGDQVLLEVSW